MKRRWRILIWVIGGHVVLFAALLGILLWLLAHLETPAVKGRVRTLLQEDHAVELDYERLSVGLLSGLVLEGLDVRKPVSAAVGRLELRWDALAAMTGGIHVEELLVSDVRVDLVVGGDASPGTEPEKATALSRALQALALPAGLAVDSVRVDGVSGSFTQMEGGDVVHHVELEGLGLSASVVEREGKAEVSLTLESPADGPGTKVVVDGKAVVAKLRAKVDILAPERLSVELDLALQSQAFDERVTVTGPLLGLAAEVVFEPEQQRTTVKVTRLSLIDDGARVTAQTVLLDQPGGGAEPGPISAKAALDLVKLVSALPPGLVDLAVEKGAVELDVGALELDPATRLPIKGSLAVKADVAGVRFAADDVEATLGALATDLSGRPVVGGAFDLKGTVRIEALGLRQPSTRTAVDAGEARLGLELVGVKVTPGKPLATKGAISVDAGLSDLRLATAGGRIEAGEVGLTVGTTLTGAAPYAVDLAIPLKGLEVRKPGGGALLARTNGRVAVHVTDAHPDLEDPTKSRARIRAEVDLGPVQARVKADKGAREVRYEVSADAPSLGLVATVAPKDIRWDRLGLAFKSKGLVRNPTRPKAIFVDHTTSLALKGLSMKQRGLTLSLRSLSLDATTKGSARAHRFDVALEVASPRYNDFDSAHTHRVTLKGSFDKPRSKLAVKATARAPEGPNVDLSLDAAFMAKARTVVHDLSLAVSKLGGISALVPKEVQAEHRLSWDTLAVRLTSKGELREVVRRLKGGTSPVLADDPAAVAAGTEALELAVDGLSYAGGGHELAAHGLHMRASTTFDPRDVSLDLNTSLASASQDFVPGYPLGDVSLVVKARVHELRNLRLDELKLVNAAGGTTFEASGSADQGVAMRGTLSQRLDGLAGFEQFGTASGDLSASFRVDSADRTSFRVSGLLRAAALALSIPEQKVDVQGVDGSISILQEVALLPEGGVRIVPGASLNAWSKSRFQDVHPYLGKDSFLSIRSVRVGEVQVGPIAGNMRLNRNLLSIDQLQAELMGGHVTGQLVVDTIEGARHVLFRGNVTGLQPSAGGEKLDANAALAFHPDKLELEGRVQLVRIGRQHLRDLLDGLDPYHEDPNMNRARMALAIGYPKRVRIHIDHGFLSVQIELGGAAGLVKLNEIRGIAMGPLLEKHLGPIVQPGGSE
jgi:translocation and assembly module TamB